MPLADWCKLTQTRPDAAHWLSARGYLVLFQKKYQIRVNGWLKDRWRPVVDVHASIPYVERLPKAVQALLTFDFDHPMWCPVSNNGSGNRLYFHNRSRTGVLVVIVTRSQTWAEHTPDRQELDRLFGALRDGKMDAGFIMYWRVRYKNDVPVLANVQPLQDMMRALERVQFELPF
jgi:hypothetical protein